MCKGCTERHPGCHTVCEEYKDFKAQKDAERESRRREGDAESDEVERTRNRIKKGCAWRRGGR